MTDYSKFRVHMIGPDWEGCRQPEFGYLVKGTEEPSEAIPFLAGYIAAGQEPFLPEQEALELASRLKPTPGLYRWNPCSRNSCWEPGDHRPHRPGHMERVSQRGYGVFSAVYFEW